MVSDCSMCGLGARTTLVSIGLWTLLQSTLYTGLSSSAILVHRCFIDLTENAFQYLLYFIYFRDKECGADRLDILFDNIPPDAVLPVFPAVTTVAHRTYIISFIYVILSFLWLLSSIILLTGTCISCMGRRGFYLFFLPWIMITIGNILMDIAATVFFSIDLTNSLNIESLLRWLEAENIENSLPYLDGVNNIALMIPSIVMLTFSCRVLFIFIMNIFCVFLVISAGLKFSEEVPSKRSSFDGFEYVTEQTQRSSGEMRYNDQIQHSNGNEAIYRMYMKNNSNYYENDGFVSDSELTNRSSKRHSESAESKRSSEYTGVKRTVEKLKGGDDISQLSHDKRSVDSKSQSSMELQEKPIKRIPPSVPKKPVKKPTETNQVQSNRNLHETNEELRSQLPWSYFQSRETHAPRPQSTQENGIINPPIPVPDYTLHFPKKERQTFGREQ